METNPVEHPAHGSPLSPRETAVLEMVAAGLTNGQTAERLGVSVHAIKFHLASIYRKLGVSNRTEAAIRFVVPNAPPVTATSIGHHGMRESS